MVSASSSSTSIRSRRPTMERLPAPNLPGASTFSSHANMVNGSRRVSGQASGREDDGLVMREKDDGSIGKAGAVVVGVTKPKRRLSSLPSLPHPFHSSVHNRPVTVNGSPYSSPSGPPHTAPQYNQQSHSSSTYQALQNALISGASTSTHYLSPQPAYRPSSPRIDETGGLLPLGPRGPEKPDRDSSPRLFGVELKWISLVTLALQNAFLTIIMHYSRISASPNKTYSAATAVLLNELLKGSISVVIALKRIDTDMLAAPLSYEYSEKDSKDTERRPVATWYSPFQSSRLRFLARNVFSPDCYQLSIPAILYVIQNNLQYVAASNLDVATFQVTYQMKILTTAFFSVLLLRKRLSKAKWTALVMLAVGVGIVQLQSTFAPAAIARPASGPGIKFSKGSAALRSEIPDESEYAPLRIMHPFRGFIAVTLACFTSGLAGVYFEFILKASSGSTPAPDLWVRNTQLSLFSLVPALVPILIMPSGPEGVGWLGRVMASFSNFNGWALGTVLTQTLGGLITAVVIRYSDNIMKGFATSLSIIISFLASVALFSYPITLAFIVGSSIVLASTYLYNAPSDSNPSSGTRTAVGVPPGSPIPTTAPILGEPDRPSRASSVINILGLGSSSSRQPSMSDLRGQAQHQLSFSHMTPLNHGHGFYSASAPGTPYEGSGHSSISSLYDVARASPNLSRRYDSARASPNLSVNIPSRTGSPGLLSAESNGGKTARPSLTLEIGGEKVKGGE